MKKKTKILLTALGILLLCAKALLFHIAQTSMTDASFFAFIGCIFLDFVLFILIVYLWKKRTEQKENEGGDAETAAQTERGFFALTGRTKTVIRNIFICVLILLFAGFCAYMYWGNHRPTVPQELRGLYVAENGSTVELGKNRVDCHFVRDGESYWDISAPIDSISGMVMVYDAGADDDQKVLPQITVKFLSLTTIEVYLNGELQGVMNKSD